jgi:hypothetical protein
MKYKLRTLAKRLNLNEDPLLFFRMEKSFAIKFKFASEDFWVLLQPTVIKQRTATDLSKETKTKKQYRFCQLPNS